MNGESDYEHDEDEQLHHVLLPRVLPQEKGNLFETEIHLMNRMVNNVENLVEYLPPKTVQLFQSIRKVHTERSPTVVSNEIKALQPGNTFAMFVRSQHSAIMIHVPQSEEPNNITNAIVATIPGGLHPSLVYKYESDMEFNYPEQANRVKFSEMLKSEDFAGQLCVLFKDLPIERQNRDCVPKWLVALLINEKSTAAANFPIITKKIRDEMFGDSNTNYFRRSSFYMSLKVLLQHNLTMHCANASNGKLVYKIVMLKFLTDITAPYKEYDSFNMDLLQQMIAKLARRIEKLTLPATVPDKTAEFHKTVIDETKAAINVIRRKIDEQIYKIHQSDEDGAQLPPLTGLNFSDDICHRMEKLKDHLGDRNKLGLKPTKNKLKPISTYARYFKNGFPETEPINDPLTIRIFWLEFEKMVLYGMQMNDDRWNAGEVRTWSFKYAEYAETQYMGNPLFMSRMLLVRLKLVAMLDRRATEKYQLLKEHHSGINPKIFESLLIPQRKDMQIAYELEQYFEERNSGDKFPSLISEATISNNSFSVKYARENSIMKTVRDKILKEDRSNLVQKTNEWKEGRRKVENLRNIASNLKCSYYFRNGNRLHLFFCDKCDLNKNADRVRVTQYEHLLPENESEQFAIVFELKIPKEIACLRDVLYKFNEFCSDDAEQLDIEGNWKQRLAKFNSSNNEYVTLGSETEGEMIDFPVDCPFERFVVESSYNCVFHADGKSTFGLLPDDCIKTLCTFETSGEYADLQWTLESTKHTENQVLSAQSKCRQDLTLSEYKNYGTLRGDGHRLQLRKLYVLIKTEALAFEQESVLALIMQTLWECEKSGENGFIRESHIDFADTNFCSAMILVLHEFLDRQRNNWTHPFKLLMVALIAVRAFEINDSLVPEISQLIQKTREIALEWIGKIETSVRNMINFNEKVDRDLRLKLIYVAIAGGLTYFVHPSHHTKYETFKTVPNALQSWLQFVITLNNNIRLYTNDERQLPSMLRNFLRLMESVGIDLEPAVTSLASSHNIEVFSLIRKQWSRAESAIFEPIRFDTNYSQILIAKSSDHQIVSIDIITGSFLVGGLPLSRLPHDIMQSEPYQWFFDNVVFEVQPDSQGNFSTLHAYNGCSYNFQRVNQQIIITEQDSTDLKELIDWKMLKGDFPHYLVTKYSHWWNKTENCIEFRQRTFAKKHFSNEPTIDYRLDLAHCHLIEVQTKRKLLDIKSESFQKIVAQLTRLEHSKYIHILLKCGLTENKEVASVELKRMNLKFTVECDKLVNQPSELISNEFGGMRVRTSQKIGTLYGLQHGLVLEGDTKILLVPNAPIRKIRMGQHASVSINNRNELCDPPFYQYQVDEICRQLKASNGTDAAWFYLAYLHAITSHGEIEPFSGMSGTERAIQILQSAYVWSSSPYDMESVKMLKAIANLTPIRQWKKGKDEFNKQTVEWPEGIPPRSAQDCFIFIARKLLNDSQRLQGLYPRSTKGVTHHKTNIKLNERDHWRCQQLSPNLRVSEEFMQRKLLRTSLPKIGPIKIAENTRTVCNLYQKRQFYVPSNINLKKYLTGGNNLVGTANKERIPKLLIHNVREEFRDLWISLYEAARKRGSTEFTLEQFTIILSFFVHHGRNNMEIEAILALQAVYMNPSEFEQINPPDVQRFEIAKFKDREVRDLLDSFIICPPQYFSDAWKDNGSKRKYDLMRTTIIDDITSDIVTGWNCMPFPSYNFAEKWSQVFEYIDYDDATTEMDKRLKIWHENELLNSFIENVEERLKRLRSSSLNASQQISHQRPAAKNWTKYQIDFEAKMIANLTDSTDVAVQNEAQGVWNTSTKELNRSAHDWFKIYEDIGDADRTHHLIQAGLSPRIVPSLLLPKIVDTGTDNRLKCLLGAWAVTIAREQRQNRIRIYSQRPEFRAACERENANEPHSNWKPCEYPEWLLFEIEQNSTIRKIQIEIAKRMIDPPAHGDIKHSVMQLNMGEGKTTVIVPILAARLANQQHACQITVLKSLFTTNLKALRQYLGSFLNRRIYVFPFRRDLPVEQNINRILEIYKECKQNKGVILTLPDYRLSFQLKIYESIENEKFATTEKLLETYKWTNANIRNVLDESDAILDAKYQLIYTIGNQKTPDGDSQRWLVTQAVLKRVPFHMKELYRKYGRDKIEFNGLITYRPDIFIPCRILDDTDTMFEELKMLLVKDFFGGLIDINLTGFTSDKKQKLERLLTQKIVEPNVFTVMNDFPAEQGSKIWIFSGLLRCEVLKSALTKRWRVNYGINPNGQRKMAIPFKAKDVAAEMTEFGHPDLAVCLTQLSYYYGGLTDAQLKRVFSILDNMQDRSAIYGKWIEGIPIESMDPSIESYDGVNLEDPNQRDELLFPLLRKNMHVVDFYILNLVSNELKAFEKKLVCTAWDLCSDQLTHKVTGFSGTNDTKNILPMPIAQNDLMELENTNATMRRTLLQPRNQPYKRLPPNVSGMEILCELVEHGIPVLLDSGALMLELNNKQVAVEWIKLAPTVDAAVYFDESDTLQTIDRNGIVTQFDYSVYRENLANCVVYLDDSHTRGTDLKFPLDWRACVTLSGDITRDKTVQSCMRMRQLESSQSISFWASHEADVRIRKVCELGAQEEVKNEHVIRFLEHNSRQFEKANMIHWTMASINYAKKLIGHTSYENAIAGTSAFDSYKICVDKDLMKLSDMYGEKKEVSLRNVAWAKLSTLSRDCKGRELLQSVRYIQDFVSEKLDGNETMFTQLFDEEQEKELELEVEQQTQVERPPGAEPAEPQFDPRLENLVVNGSADAHLTALLTDGTLLTIPQSLGHTELNPLCLNNGDAWANHLLVTKNFQTVIKNSVSNCDEFLRPVRWIAHIENPSDTRDYKLVLLSTFECERLLTAFRNSKNATLIMYRPRLSRAHSNLIHETKLHVSDKSTATSIGIHDEVQIGVYSGMMYFDSALEQDAYCGFLGLIPQPRTGKLNEAFEYRIIGSDGFVQRAKRSHPDVSQHVGQCKFNNNPVNLAIGLINAHHKCLPEVSHVASILIKDMKVSFDENTMEID